MRISDWSSDVCSSDLRIIGDEAAVIAPVRGIDGHIGYSRRIELADGQALATHFFRQERQCRLHPVLDVDDCLVGIERSEEHTSELQSLMRISYAVFCLKKKKKKYKKSADILIYVKKY